MKNTLKTIGTLAITVIMFASCGSSIEGDAAKLATLMCKSTELSKKAVSGDMSGMKEAQKMMMEAAELKEELEGRYSDKKAKKEFEKAVLKAMSETNCD